MLIKQWKFAILNLLVLILCATGRRGYCQNSPLSWFTETFDGSLRNTTAVRLHEMDRFVKIENRLTLRYDARFNEHLRVIVSGNAVYDAFYDVEDSSAPDYATDYAPFRHVTLRPEDDQDYHTSFELHEALLEFSFNRLDLRIGKQSQIGWGKVTGARLVDSVKPRNLREPGLSELPLWMAKLEYDLSPTSYLQFLIMPDMPFGDMAAIGSEFDALPFYLRHVLPVGRLPMPPLGWQLIIKPVEEPAVRFENTAYGVKFDSVNLPSGWDLTLNYLYTWDDEPVFVLKPSSLGLRTGTLTLYRIPERLHIVGGTASTNAWKGTLRGEIAAKFGKQYYVDSQNWLDFTVEKTLLSYALEFERKLFDISWLVQALQERILDYDAALVSDDVQTTFALGGLRSFRDDTLDVACFVSYAIPDKDVVIRPSVQYAFKHAFKIKAGATLFEGGDDDSLTGYFGEKDQVYLELKYSF